MGNPHHGRTLELRRHSYTKKEQDGRGRGSALSRAGVALARRLGQQTGPFDHVLTSNVARTAETALAMGFAVDDTTDMATEGMWKAATAEKGAHHSQWDWGDQAFVRYATLVRNGGATADLGQYQVRLWRAVLDRLAPGASGLIITHGGLLEPGLVTLLPQGDHDRWAGVFGHCEGFRVVFEDGEPVRMEMLRVTES